MLTLTPKKMWKIVIFLSYFAHFVYCYEVIEVPSAPRTNMPIAIIWDEPSQSAYYTDHRTNGTQWSLFRYDFGSNTVYPAYIPNFSSPSSILPDGNVPNRFIVAVRSSIIAVTWDGTSEVAEYEKTIVEIPKIDSTSAVGVMRQDLHGNLLFSTYEPKELCGGPSDEIIYKYSIENGLQPLASGVIDVNGWSSTNDINYLSDACTGIYSLPADCDSNCELTSVFNSRAKGDYLLGLDFTDDEKLISTSYNEGTLWKIDPQTKSGEAIASIGHGGCGGAVLAGPNLDVMLVTAASYKFDPMNPEEIIEYYGTPSLYRIEGLGLKGVTRSDRNSSID